LTTGQRDLLTLEDRAAAIVSAIEAELVVDPGARRKGLGGRLLATVLERSGDDLLLWAHGNHPGARALARRHRLTPARTLLQLRTSVPAVTAEPARPAGSITAFRPGVDDEEWLALNALAFASHPEQGKLTQRDLDARIAEDWFNPEDFLLARDPQGELTGFCWLKVEADLGEFYAVGVDPRRQGEGLGRMLVAAGLSRLAALGIRIANLYVEADNLPAVRLYRSFGFTDYSADVQYARGEKL
jgi:mycothiol synthase